MVQFLSRNKLQGKLHCEITHEEMNFLQRLWQAAKTAKVGHFVVTVVKRIPKLKDLDLGNIPEFKVDIGVDVKEAGMIDPQSKEQKFALTEVAGQRLYPYFHRGVEERPASFFSTGMFLNAMIEDKFLFKNLGMTQPLTRDNESGRQKAWDTINRYFNKIATYYCEIVKECNASGENLPEYFLIGGQVFRTDSMGYYSYKEGVNTVKSFCLSYKYMERMKSFFSRPTASEVGAEWLTTRESELRKEDNIPCVLNLSYKASQPFCSKVQSEYMEYLLNAEKLRDRAQEVPRILTVQTNLGVIQINADKIKIENTDRGDVFYIHRDEVERIGREYIPIGAQSSWNADKKEDGWVNAHKPTEHTVRIAAEELMTFRSFFNLHASVMIAKLYGHLQKDGADLGLDIRANGVYEASLEMKLSDIKYARKGPAAGMLNCQVSETLFQQVEEKFLALKPCQKEHFARAKYKLCVPETNYTSPELLDNSASMKSAKVKHSRC